MSPERVIPARRVNPLHIGAYPYSSTHRAQLLADDPDGSDAPMAAALSTPEEDARRLASVDQVIYEKLQQAERDALETARRGYEEGFQAGETEGRQFGEGQFLAHLQQLDGHLRELTDALSLHQAAARDEVLALAVAIGEYLAGHAIEHGAEHVASLLDAALAAHPFPGATEETGPAVVVYLHPRDLDALGPAPGLHPGVALREDPALSRGGLRVETADGVLDATMDRRIANLRALIERFREQEAK